jgi:hypothetical protein
MSGYNFYKYAFWLLLISVASFQVIITIVAHSRHEDSHSMLLSNGGRHPLKVSKHPSNEAQLKREQHEDIKSTFSSSNLHKRKVWEEVLSTAPRIVLLHNFATKEE